MPTNAKAQDQDAKAAAYAFLLLKFRQRSESEMRRRMTAKHFDPAAIARVLARLKQGRYIDDEAYARALVEELRNKPLGPARIRLKMMQRGFPLQLIDRCLKESQGKLSEREAAKQVARERLQALMNDEPQAQRRKLYGYLARRGFSAETIQDVMESL